jgi:hypothetical protein
MTSTDDTEKHGGGEQPGHQDADGRDGKHPIKITVRTLAGHSHEETIKPTDTVAEVTHAAAGTSAQGGAVRWCLLPRAAADRQRGGARPHRHAARRRGVDDDVLVLIPTPARNKLGGYPRIGGASGLRVAVADRACRAARRRGRCRHRRVGGRPPPGTGLIALTGPNGMIGVPAFQITAAGEPRPELRPLLQELLVTGIGGWAAWTSLTAPSSLLSGEVPEQLAATDPARAPRAATRFCSRRRGMDGVGPDLKSSGPVQGRWPSGDSGWDGRRQVSEGPAHWSAVGRGRGSLHRLADELPRGDDPSGARPLTAAGQLSGRPPAPAGQLDTLCQYCSAAGFAAYSRGLPTFSARTSGTSSGVAKMNSRRGFARFWRRAAKLGAAPSRVSPRRRKSTGVDVIGERHRCVHEFADAIHRRQAPGHADLDDGLAETRRCC